LQFAVTFPKEAAIRTLAILAALPEEIGEILEQMEGHAVTHTIGMRDYHVGTLMGHRCVVTLARIGKVAAAATTVVLIREFGVTEVVFTGLAGGIHPSVNVGDVVVGTELKQYDLDARPLFPQYEVPLLGISRFEASAELSSALEAAARNFLADGLARAVDPTTWAELKLGEPQLHTGLIVTGDRFVNEPRAGQMLRQSIPDALCVEMEGAAVAQVCHEFGVPFAVLRTVSDRADHAATVDFTTFLNRVARVYSAGILRRFLETRSAR